MLRGWGCLLLVCFGSWLFGRGFGFPGRRDIRFALPSGGLVLFRFLGLVWFCLWLGLGSLAVCLVWVCGFGGLVWLCSFD